jgi:hypothetical protein
MGLWKDSRFIFPSLKEGKVFLRFLRFFMPRVETCPDRSCRWSWRRGRAGVDYESVFGRNLRKKTVPEPITSL